MLTKQEEIDLYQRLIEQCPEGYVRDILCDAQLAVTKAIRDDLCSGDPLREVIGQRMDEQRALAGLQAAAQAARVELGQVNDQIREVRKIRENLLSQLAVLASEARQVSYKAEEVQARVKKLAE
jgi:hypothetical protein